MKRILSIVIFSLTFCLSGYSKDFETTTPLFDIKVERKVSILDIEGEYYYDVVVTMKSSSFLFNTKVIVRDQKGKKIWKKTFGNAFLYVFSSGQIQIGRKNFNQVLIQPTYGSKCIGKIRVKEGVY